MSKTTINKQQLALEFISVVFAVLLALFLNALRETMYANELLSRVKVTISEEIVKNDSLLRESFAYRRKLVQDLRNKEYVVQKIPIKELDIDISNDRALESLFRRSVFHWSNYVDRVLVRSNESTRTLVLGDKTYRLEIRKDTLLMLGIGNIRLRTAGISNQSWNIAQATNVLVDMDLDLVRTLSQLNKLQEDYLKTSDKAIDMIYEGKPQVVSVLEDMVYYESQIIKTDSIMLVLLEK